MSALKTGLPAVLLAAALALAGSGCGKQAKKKRFLARADTDLQAERFDRAEMGYLAVLSIPPHSPEALAGLGFAYFAEGKLPQAAVVLRQAAQARPDNQEVKRRLALVCLSLNHSAEARDLALSLLEKQPHDLESLFLLAQSAATTNEANEVVRRIEMLPPAIQNAADCRLARGTAFVVLLRPGEAETEFKAAVARDPKSSKAYLMLGSFYAMRNNPGQAGEALKSAAALASFRSPERLRYADWELQHGAVDVAKSTAEEMTRKAPDYVPAWTFLARLAYAQKQIEECNNLVKTVLSRDPVNLQGLLLKGSLLLASPDATNAISHFERVTALYPNAPLVHYGLALAQLQLGEISKASVSLNKCLSFDTNFSDALLLKANIDLRKGEVSSAITSLVRLVKQQPQLAQAHLLLASAYLAKKSPEEALLVYRHMTEVFPRSPEVPLLMGIVLAEENKKEEAQKAFEQSLQISRDYLPAVEKLVDLDLLDKRYPTAIQRIEAQIELHPTNAEPWLLMAKIHMARAARTETSDPTARAGPGSTNLQIAETPEARTETAQAESALLKAIELNPGLRTSYLLLSQIYIATHEQQKALDQLQTLVTKTNDVVALIQMGMIYDALKNYSEARDSYERALKVNPRFSLALNNLAYLYSERFGQLDKAYEMASKARELMPHDPATADTLGWVLYQRGEYARALGLLEDSAAKLPADPEIQFHLGMTSYMMGDEAAARTALERAVKANRDFPGKPQAVRRLAVLGIDGKTATDAQISEVQQVLHDVPEDPVALERFASIQCRQGQFEKAAQSYQAALKRNPRNPEAMLQLASIWFEHLNDSAKALDLAKQAHAVAPEDARISRLLGRLVCQTQDYRWAASLLEESRGQLPVDPAASYDLGWAYYCLGRVADAEAQMRTVAEGDAGFPRHTEAQTFLAMVAAGRSPSATQANAAEVQLILTRNPGYLPALMASASLLEAKGEFQQAAKIYSDVLQRSPSFAPATRNLALLYAEHLNEDQKAYEMTRKALETFPEDARLAKDLGIICYRRGDYRRTVQLLDPKTREDQTDAELFYYLGMAYYQLKERRQSKSALERALGLKLDGQLASEATRVLGTID